ncbi:sugar ABC transporter permease [Luteipulveratus mongoliensis]|uniref:Uncharacterized protein n=1 Tax=Luteipulveratus mongoliensis TaxID=571913 RepID=A0A0K1JE31_9MICO|nr:sugar ABC transporter permease [Luteipulveratus mongoliensis]AKU14845.1 hypothetical protein VV02_01460 [Luteipulveratus mongoliensis]
MSQPPNDENRWAAEQSAQTQQGGPNPPASTWPGGPGATSTVYSPYVPRVTSYGQTTPVGLRVLGAALLLPAVFFWIRDLVVPSWQTAKLSTENRNPLRDTATSVGMDNYENLDYGKALVFALSLALLPALIALVVGPIIGAVAARASTPLRRVITGVLGVLVLLVGTTGIILASLPERSLGDGMDVRVIAMLCGLPVVVGLSGLVFVAVSRTRSAESSGMAPVATAVLVGIIALMAIVAIAIQSLAPSLVATTGGPKGETLTPNLLAYQSGFQRMQFGRGAASQTLTLVIVGVLGLIAGLLILGSRLRVEPAAAEDSPGRSNVSGIVAIVLAVLAVVVIAVLLHDWATGLSDTDLPRGASTPPNLTSNTWTPGIPPAGVAALVAALGGFGLGALRPLGRVSEWLLLPFMPWLFVGLGTLSMTHFIDQIGDDRTLTPPMWVSVPALVVCTLVSAGVRRRWDESQARGGPAPLAAILTLPAAVLLMFLGLIVSHAQNIGWQLAVAVTPEDRTGPVTLVQLRNEMFYTGSGSLPYGLANPLPLTILLAVAGAGLCALLGSLTIRAGRPKWIA